MGGRAVRSKSARELAAALPFLGLWFIGFIGLIALPVVLVLYWSFTDFNLFTQPHWVGTANYNGLIGDSTFWKSVFNTAYLALIGVPAGLVMGLGTALLLNRPVFGRGFYRAAVFLPGIVPPVVGALVFVWILNPNYGLLNAVLSLFRIPAIGWLGDPTWAKLAELLMVLWGSVGTTMVVCLAGLKEIPEHLYEAAAIDGGSRWSQFRYITLPMLSPVIFYNIIVGVIFYLQFFEQAFVITSQDIGAPVNSTLYFSLYLYQNAFLFLKMGTASAMAWVLFVTTGVITALFFALQKRFVFYLGDD
jgi:multiple sugar transport system permease protein